MILLAAASVKVPFYEAADAPVASLQCELNGSTSLYDPELLLSLITVSAA